MAAGTAVSGSLQGLFARQLSVIPDLSHLRFGSHLLKVPRPWQPGQEAGTSWDTIRVAANLERTEVLVPVAFRHFRHFRLRFNGVD